MFLKLSKFFLYASVFSVTIVMTSTFFPFIGGKDYFFRASISFALVFFFLFWGFEAARGEVGGRLRALFSRPIVIAVSLFVFAFLLASILAHDPHAAFWSNYERGEGGFQMLHYYVFFLLLLLLFTERDWRSIMWCSIVAAAFVILYGVFAQLGLRTVGFTTLISPYTEALPEGVWKRLTETRFQGSLGNPAYVAPYLMFSMFYALFVWLSRLPGNVRESAPERSLRFEKTERAAYQNRVLPDAAQAASGDQLRRTLFWVALLAAFLFFFIVSQTRGAFFGLGAAVIAYLAYLIVATPALRKPALVALGGFTVLVAILFTFKDAPAIRKLPGSRFLDTSIREQTVQTRLWTWGSAWRGFLERPLLGWGPENFSAVFDRHFDTRHFVPGKNTETWFDRAHSVILDYLAEAGITGLLSYFGMFAVFAAQFFRHHRRHNARGHLEGERGIRSSRALTYALFPAMSIGYLVQGLALFDVLPIYLNLFLFLAFSSFFFERATQTS